jgi:UDP-2-acetamido-3-amino-2,3-dideoxy-glucuronate N-acetyltransferase
MPVINTEMHPSVVIWHPELVNIYNSKIGENTKIASFVEIGDSVIGRNCKIEAFAFIPPGSVIEDNVFIGPHVTLTNDRYPSAKPKAWSREPVTVKRGASIGAASVICPGVIIGENSLVGAGSVVSRNVLPCHVVHGEQAKFNRVLIEE